MLTAGSATTATSGPITRLRERVGTALLDAATELAFDQQAIERSFATVPSRTANYSSAESAVAMARWADSVLFRLAWWVLPGTLTKTLEPVVTADGRPRAGRRGSRTSSPGPG